jgi:uncharacterized protein (DUF488 family)
MFETLRAYSLGYQGISLEQYVNVLKDNNVSMVIDVRETPWSYKPGFSKKPLSEGLQANGIAYVHVKSAGNPKANRKMGLPQAEVIERYKEHLEGNPGCLDEIYELIAGRAWDGAVCLLCFEEKPHDCHRKVILDKLSEKKGKLMTCHLYSKTALLKEPISNPRVPKPNDRETARKHAKVSKEQSRLVFA